MKIPLLLLLSLLLLSLLLLSLLLLSPLLLGKSEKTFVVNRAMALERSGDREAAVDLICDALLELKKDPRSAPRFARGAWPDDVIQVSYGLLGKWDQRERGEAVLREQVPPPENVGSGYSWDWALAHWLKLDGQLDEALELALKSSGRALVDPELHRGVVSALYQHYAQAIAEFEAWLDTHPDSEARPNVQGALAVLLRELGREAEANALELERLNTELTMVRTPWDLEKLEQAFQRIDATRDFEKRLAEGLAYEVAAETKVSILLFQKKLKQAAELFDEKPWRFHELERWLYYFESNPEVFEALLKRFYEADPEDPQKALWYLQTWADPLPIETLPILEGLLVNTEKNQIHLDEYIDQNDPRYPWRFKNAYDLADRLLRLYVQQGDEDKIRALGFVCLKATGCSIGWRTLRRTGSRFRRSHGTGITNCCRHCIG